MKKIYAVFAIATISMLSSCLKDTATQTYHYKIYKPVIVPISELRAAIKSSNTAEPIVNPGKLFLLGNYIFLSEKEKGIHVIDNSNPAKPVNKGFITIPGNQDVVVENNMLYADCYTDLMAIDISNPDNITVTKYLADIFPERRFGGGNYYVDSTKIVTEWAFVKDTATTTNLGYYNVWPGGFVLQSSSAVSNSKSTGVAGSMSKLAVLNNYLYAISQSTLNAVSVSPSNYFANKKTYLARIGAGETIYPFKDKLFIGASSGMTIFDVSVPDQPNQMGVFSHAKLCDPVITDGDNAYVTLRSGNACSGTENELDVVNVQNLYSPSLIKKYNLSHPKGLSKDGNILMVCDEGLRVFDATTPDNLILKKTISIDNPYDVICLNGIAIVSAEDGLYQYKYINASNISLLSKIGLSR
jgi:hypothetical protein